MRHDWVLDVLDDLVAYALRNSLPAVAEGARALRQVAEQEIAATDPNGPPSGATGGGGQIGGPAF